MSEKPYFKVIMSGGELKVLTIYEDDESAYESARFLSDLRYGSEKDAQGVIDGIHRLLGAAQLRAITRFNG